MRFTTLLLTLFTATATATTLPRAAEIQPQHQRLANPFEGEPVNLTASADMAGSPSDRYIQRCRASRNNCDAGFMIFEQVRYLGKWSFGLRDPEDVLKAKQDATCYSFPPRYNSIKLHKADINDQTWGCALYKDAGCAGKHEEGNEIWITRSMSGLPRGWWNKMQSLKCWRSGTW